MTEIILFSFLFFPNVFLGKTTKSPSPTTHSSTGTVGTSTKSGVTTSPSTGSVTTDEQLTTIPSSNFTSKF